MTSDKKVKKKRMFGTAKFFEVIYRGYILEVKKSG